MWMLNLILIIFLSVSTIKNVKSNITDNSIEDEVVYQKYIEMDKSLKSLTRSVIKSMLPRVLDANEHVNVSAKCTRSLFLLASELRSLKMSALKMLDATAKLPEGFLTGKVFLLGDYKECLTTVVTQRNGEVAFKGQYCVVNGKPLLPKLKESQTMFEADENFLAALNNTSEFMKFLANHLQVFHFGNLNFGVCVPTDCSIHDVNEMVGYIAGHASIKTRIEYCDYEGKHEVFTTRMLFAICNLLLLGVLVLIGTVYEYCCKEKENSETSIVSRLLISFSILTNLPKLVSSKTSENMLAFLHGLRVLCLVHIIILYKAFISGRTNMSVHTFRAKHDLRSVSSQIVLNGYLTIDVFFFIGGLVNCYSRMKMNEENEESKGCGKPLKLIIAKLWKIQPALILTTTVLPFLFDQCHGPRSILSKELMGDCEQNWWKSLIFVNVFFDQRTEVCMAHTWYVSADFLLFVLSLFTIPLLFKNIKRGLVLHLIIILLGVSSASYWAWHKTVWPRGLVLRPFREDIDRFYNADGTPLPHVAPYFTGIIVGCVLYKRKGLKFSKFTQVFGWTAAFVCISSMLFMPYFWNNGTPYTLVECAIYFGFSRLVYSLGIAWIVISCFTGQKGILNTFLSFGLWIPLSRMSYMAYLVAPAILLFYSGNVQVGDDNQEMYFIWILFGDIMAIYLASFTLALIGESPFLTMEKKVFGRKSREKIEDDDRGMNNPVFINIYDTENGSPKNLNNITDTAKL